MDNNFCMDAPKSYMGTDHSWRFQRIWWMLSDSSFSSFLRFLSSAVSFSYLMSQFCCWHQYTLCGSLASVLSSILVVISLSWSGPPAHVLCLGDQRARRSVCGQSLIHLFSQSDSPVRLLVSKCLSNCSASARLFNVTGSQSSCPLPFVLTRRYWWFVVVVFPFFCSRSCCY